MLDILPIDRVVRAGLCTGCGACAAAAPESISMEDRADRGKRPRFSSTASPELMALASRVCPGSGLRHANPEGEWGPVLEVWQGHAMDPEVRFKGSSGGVATALSIFCIEEAQMYGVLHTAAREGKPYLNETVVSTSRNELLSRTGSRYAPASPCDGLAKIEEAPSQCVFIGKPCDVAAANTLARERTALHRRLGLTISIFCAGTPSTEGTLEMLRMMGIETPAAVRHLKYRGHGWPGDVVARQDGPAGRSHMTYERAWGEILTRHKQWRCKLCADHTGEFADLAVGDAWHLRREGDPGQSIVVVRTERGRRVLHAAIASGDLSLKRVGMTELKASQPSLEQTRGAVWGRILALRIAGKTAPSFHGMRMARVWWARLSLREKARSVIGTWKRAAAATEPPPRVIPEHRREVIEAKIQTACCNSLQPVPEGAPQ